MSVDDHLVTGFTALMFSEFALCAQVGDMPNMLFPFKSRKCCMCTCPPPTTVPKSGGVVTPRHDSLRAAYAWCNSSTIFG